MMEVWPTGQEDRDYSGNGLSRVKFRRLLGFAVCARTRQSKAGADSGPLQLFRIWSFMTRSTLVLSFLASLIFIVGAAPQAHAESAKHWFKQGQKAEQRNDIETAYQDYYKAYKMKPGNVR